MERLKTISAFSAPIKDLIQIYMIYIRSMLEQSCVIWHSTLTKEDSDNLERVQNNALQNILKERYSIYENYLKLVEYETKFQSREK